VCASLFRGGSRTSDLSCMAHHHRRRVASSSSPRLLDIVGPFFTAGCCNAPREPRRDRLNYTWRTINFPAIYCRAHPAASPTNGTPSYASSLALFACISANLLLRFYRVSRLGGRYPTIVSLGIVRELRTLMKRGENINVFPFSMNLHRLIRGLFNTIAFIIYCL